MPSTCSVLPRVLAAVEVADEQVDSHPHTLLIGCTQPMRTGKGPQMANSHPKLNPQNLRPPWQPGTSGNPAGYSQGRRISDAIENMIDELDLERSFAATAIAMALGHKHTLTQLVKDPVTGEDVWVEHKPDLKWFKMIVPQPRIEPAAQQIDPVTRLRTILQDLERERAAQAEQDKAAESPERSQSDPCHVNEQAQSASTRVPCAGGGFLLSCRTCQRTQASARSLQAAQADLPAGDPGTTLAVERPSGQRGADRERSSRAVQSGPACCPAQGVPSSSACGTVHWKHPRLSSREHPGPAPIGRRARPGAGGDRRRGLLPALSPARRPG